MPQRPAHRCVSTPRPSLTAAAPSSDLDRLWRVDEDGGERRITPQTRDHRGMTDQQTGAEDGEVIEVDQTDSRSAWPFIAAAVLAGIVIVAVVLGGLLSPAEKNVTDAD